ncbi:MAG: electron transport complex subunit RsxE [Erysipelotrichaceae bacterium]|nr:electron transport complex subunit RsxE [Erysipelotrichaceae bacterium]
MSEKKEKKQSLFTRLLVENPVFGLYLGICSALAITTNINNAIGMGIAVTIVLTLSNILVSSIRNLTPNDIHIPVYIVIIATLVTIVGMVIQAYTPSLYSALGAFIDLIVVNCIILGRAEAFASMNPIGPSILDGLTMGFSYTLSILTMSFFRQILGTGVLSLSNPFTNAEIFSLRLIPEGFELPFFKEQFGAFITFACLAAAVSAYKTHVENKEKSAEL